jgi:hypothetical protein
MKNLPTKLWRTGAVIVVSLGLAIAARAAANPKAGDRPNPKSSETHPGDEHAAEGKAKAEAKKNAAHDKSALERYDANRNGKLDPDEIAAMQADKTKPDNKGKGKGKRS